MQIVIDIPWQIKETLNCENQWSALLLAELKDIVNNGTPLPEEHGRLIDADKIEFTHTMARSCDDGHIWTELCATQDEISDLPTILEAERNEK